MRMRDTDVLRIEALGFVPGTAADPVAWLIGEAEQLKARAEAAEEALKKIEGFEVLQVNGQPIADAVGAYVQWGQQMAGRYLNLSDRFKAEKARAEAAEAELHQLREQDARRAGQR
jgi:hypothetical protein